MGGAPSNPFQVNITILLELKDHHHHQLFLRPHIQTAPSIDCDSKEDTAKSDSLRKLTNRRPTNKSPRPHHIARYKAGSGHKNWDTRTQPSRTQPLAQTILESKRREVSQE